jgi:hypothetical protein
VARLELGDPPAEIHLEKEHRVVRGVKTNDNISDYYRIYLPLGNTH